MTMLILFILYVGKTPQKICELDCSARAKWIARVPHDDSEAKHELCQQLCVSWWSLRKGGSGHREQFLR